MTNSERATDNGKLFLIIFSAAAALTAALVGIGTYILVASRTAGDPRHILSLCNSAIEQIERDLTFTDD